VSGSSGSGDPMLWELRGERVKTTTQDMIHNYTSRHTENTELLEMVQSRYNETVSTCVVNSPCIGRWILPSRTELRAQFNLLMSARRYQRTFVLSFKIPWKNNST